MKPIKSLTVYCSASDNIDSKYLALSSHVGKFLAENNIRLVYGGGSHSMMGSAANACLHHGGNVLGVMPYSLLGKEGFIQHDHMQYIYVSTMGRRKFYLEKHAQGALILPGGAGTMDELFALLTLKKLGIYEHPVWLMNYDGYYDPLLAMLRHMQKEKFADMPDFMIVNNYQQFQHAMQQYTL